MEGRARRVTMIDIARKSGVSQPTVSDVLNDRWREKGLAEATRDHVLAAARALNYRRNGIARRLTAGRTNLIGLVVPYIAGSFFAEITFALEMEARRRGYHVILCHSYGLREREEREIDLLLELCVDGLIVAPAFDAPPGDVYEELETGGLPLVFLDSRLDGIPAHFVGTDDIHGGRLATEHLIGLGHRRIAHLAGPQQASSTRGRCEGYRRAIGESGLAATPELIAEMSVGDRSRAQETVAAWLSADTGITAIFAASDMLAAGALSALEALGKRAGEDIAVIGYGDSGTATAWGLRVTTVRQPTQEIGREATALLIDSVENPAAGPVQRFIAPELVVRDTCGGQHKSVEADVPFWLALEEGEMDLAGLEERRTVGNAGRSVQNAELA